MASTGGARLGKALIDLAAQSRIAAAAVVRPLETAERARSLRSFLETAETELAGRVATMYARTLADPDAPPALLAALAPAAAPTHQTDAILGFVSAILGILSITGQIALIETQEYMNHLRKKLPHTVLSPAEAALSELRGHWDHSKAAGESELSGVDGERYDALFANTGEPPGVGDLLAMRRRGIINDDRLVHGIRQSRVRAEWIDAVRAYAFGPPTPSDALAGVVEGHLSDAEGQRIFTEGGIAAEHFGWMRETAGRPPGTEQMLELLNRRVVDEPTVVASIRESNVKNKYIQAILQMRVHLPPERTVVSMVRHGALAAARGVELLLDNGYSPEIAAALISEASATKTEGHKQIAESQVLAAYRDRTIDRNAAGALIEKLGYDAAEASFALDLADHEREHRFMEQHIAKAHALYVAWRINRTDAGVMLDQVAVPAPERDDLIALWEVEREASHHELTPAELRAALRANLIGSTDYTTRLVERGYTQDDADLLLALSAPPTR